MKHPFVANHRITNGGTCHLFCLQCLIDRLTSSYKRVSKYKLSKYVALILFFFGFLEVLHQINLAISFDHEACQSVEKMNSHHVISLEFLRYHIEITSYLMKFELTNFSQFGKHSLFGNQKILKNKIPICPFKPPDLTGKVEINQNEEKIDEDLRITKARLDQNRQAATNLRQLQESVATNHDDQVLQKETSLKQTKNINEINFKSPFSIDEIPSGVNSPSRCLPHRRTAIIIPYRNRLVHLQIFLRHMHEFLQRQQVEYGIYVINLAGNVKFNRAKLLNVGFKEAMSHYNKYDCVVFHDVDLLPENDLNLYTCQSQPMHMSAYINKFNYKLPDWGIIFGGVTAITPAQFEMVNGYSNIYWGWGGEDDDMYYRLLQKCMTVVRLAESIARYTMLRHGSDKGNEKALERYNLVKGSRQRLYFDGLSTLQYHVLKRDYQLLYNNITVNIGRPNNLPMTWREVILHSLVVITIFFLLYTIMFR